MILCEALIDALTFWCAGYRNVTASYGVDGFTEAHLAAFQAHGVKRVLIAYDRDDGGRPGRGRSWPSVWRRRGSRAGGCRSRRAGRERLRAEGHAGGEIARCCCVRHGGLDGRGGWRRPRPGSGARGQRSSG